MIGSGLKSKLKRTAILIGSYVAKHYKWIISTLLALIAIIVTFLVIPLSINLQKVSTEAAQTKTYYYVVKTRPKDSSKLQTANCWGSLESTRYDAWRCTVGHIIHDPCFSNSEQSYVACINDPHGSEMLFKLNITEKKNLQDSINQGTTYPWFVVLKDQTQCMYFTGMTDLVANGRIDFGCSKKGEYLSLPLETKSDTYSIKCYDPSRKLIDMCDVKEVWY